MTFTQDTRSKASEKVSELQAMGRNRIEAIRNNRDLSDEKKQKLIAKAYLDLKTGLDKVKTERDSTTATKRTTLERKLYGLPDRASASDMISYRDALDRASQIDAQDEAGAAALLKRAQTSGDELLARAVLATAYERQQVDVINQYSSANPVAYNDVEELWSIQTDRSSFVAEWEFIAPKPKEIERWSDPIIADVAANESE